LSADAAAAVAGENPTPQAPPLLYALNDRPPWPKAALAALAHLLAIVASIAAAPLLVARGLELDAATTSYVISSALMVSGIATLIQIVRVGPFGSGLLSIQGTSFAFVGALMVAGGLLDHHNLSDEALIGVLLGSAAVGAAITIVAGYFVERLSRVITQNVTGIAIFLLGLTLVDAAWSNFRFALDAARAGGGSATLVWAQGVVVIAAIAFLSTRHNPWLRLSSICLGLVIGMTFVFATGQAVPLPDEPLGGVSYLRWLPFPLGFDSAVCLVLTPIFFVTMIEALGDLTATSMLSQQTLGDVGYWRRIRGGVMADGLNSVLAAFAGTFPNTTFSQNNGVIQLTGVASRVVGVLVALMLIVLGALPGFVAVFQTIPGGVLHGATGLLFAMIALTGWRLLRMQKHVQHTMRMLVGCTLAALALTFVPGLLTPLDIDLPDWLALLFGFPVASGTLMAMIWERLAAP
jgi:NCS2 family nucleobase:cation symporter-2/xanthine permease XanP